MSFSKIKGNISTIDSIKELIKGRKFPSSSLFYGQEGCGKFIAAIETAKAHICSQIEDSDSLFYATESKNPQWPCDKCENCAQIDKRLHPDFRIVDSFFQAALLDESPEKQKNIKIDSIREISRFAYEKPYVSDKKFIIINNADTMTAEAQNSLLKILEEPPETAIIILVASDKNMLLPTIVSRTFPFKFKPLKKQELSEILGNKGIENKEAEFLASISSGSVSIAMKFRELIMEINEKKHFGQLLPFMMMPAHAQSFESRTRAKMILDFLTAMTASDTANPSIPYERKEKEISYLLNLSSWLRHNVSPRIIAELAISSYMKYGNFEFGDKI